MSSTPTVNIGNNNEDTNNSSLIHQYFVKNNSSDIAVTALSQIKNQTSISFRKDEHWTYQVVNDSLTPVGKTNILNNNRILKPRDGADHAIYLLQRTTSNKKIDPESQQYLNVYTINPLVLTINDYSDFATSNLGYAFAQYLREATNVDETINKLNVGQLRYWLLFYAHDLTNHLYANINNDNKNLQECKKQASQTKDNPWSLKTTTFNFNNNY
ncbi:hypothetical protein [Spiroplasma endosymbiont of Nebria brevicollis]|uniref:hypothetical protein n=1 Tax=Spiroplasma endosymbiont of Nebria brevicollis TaxID=3066284 RepID=UPI00313CFFA0